MTQDREMTLALSRAYCGDEHCDRHRPLAGPADGLLLKLAVSVVFTLVMGTHATDGWLRRSKTTGDHSRLTTPHYVQTPVVFDSAGVGDRVIGRIPMEPAHRPTATWLVLLYASGRVEVQGDREAMRREFWANVGLFDICAGQHGAIVIHFGFQEQHQIWVNYSGVVNLQGQPPAEAVVFWRDMATLIPKCAAEPIA